MWHTLLFGSGSTLQQIGLKQSDIFVSVLKVQRVRMILTNTQK